MPSTPCPSPLPHDPIAEPPTKIILPGIATRIQEKKGSDEERQRGKKENPRHVPQTTRMKSAAANRGGISGRRLRRCRQPAFKWAGRAQGAAPMWTRAGDPGQFAFFLSRSASATGLLLCSDLPACFNFFFSGGPFWFFALK